MLRRYVKVTNAGRRFKVTGNGSEGEKKLTRNEFNHGKTLLSRHLKWYAANSSMRG